MSFSRMGPDSDVYVFRSAVGFECCNCIMGPDFGGTKSEMLSHLSGHARRGHKVAVAMFGLLWEPDDDPLPPELFLLGLFDGAARL